MRTLESADTAGFDWIAATSYVIIVRTACRRRDYAVAERFIEAALDYCTARDLDVWRYYLLSWRSKVRLAHGAWSEAAQDAQICLAEPCPFARIHAARRTRTRASAARRSGRVGPARRSAAPSRAS